MMAKLNFRIMTVELCHCPPYVVCIFQPIPKFIIISATFVLIVSSKLFPILAGRLFVL